MTLIGLRKPSGYEAKYINTRFFSTFQCEYSIFKHNFDMIGEGLIGLLVNYGHMWPSKPRIRIVIDDEETACSF